MSNHTPTGWILHTGLALASFLASAPEGWCGVIDDDTGNVIWWAQVGRARATICPQPSPDEDGGRQPFAWFVLDGSGGCAVGTAATAGEAARDAALAMDPDCGGDVIAALVGATRPVDLPTVP